MEREQSFAHWLKQRRNALDLTQHELARLVGCAVITIQQIEGERRRPSKPMAELLSNHLEIPADQREAFLRSARTHAAVPRSAPLSHMSPNTPTNVPVPLTPLIGRAAEVAAIGTYLERSDIRLLTLIGPGGIGKTRLALQIAIDLRASYRDGICFVALAALHSIEFVVPAIAGALGFALHSPVDSQAQLLAYLRAKNMLLVLDNFEHLLTAAPLISDLLAACPDLTVLATSRAPLHIRGEQQFLVPPLALPPTDDRRPTTDDRQSDVVGRRSSVVAQYASVQLFIQRAQAVQPNFAATEANAPDVAAICIRLDGLPLAIELAGARIKLFPPSALLARLEDRLAFLTGGARDLLARQQTIRATIAWSYDMLDAAEQAIFARLAVFTGGCTLAAAEAVLADDRAGDAEVSAFIPVDIVLDGVSSLLDQSLLKQSESPDGEPCFVMLETIHEFALEQLETSGEAAILQRRYAEFYVSLAEMAAPQLIGAQAQMWLERLGAEHANLRAVLAWSIGTHGQVALGLRLATALRWFWITRSLFREGYAWFERAVAVMQRIGAAPALRAKALCAAGHMFELWGDHVQGVALLEAGITLARAEGDRMSAAEALGLLGFILCERGDYARAEALVKESLALYQAEGDSYGIILASLFLGDVAREQSHLLQASRHFEAALTLSRDAGYTILQCLALLNLGRIAYAKAEYTHAQAILLESRALFQQLGTPTGDAEVLLDLGRVARAQGNAVEAARLFAESLAWYHKFWDGKKRDIVYGLEGLAGAAAVRGQPARAARLLGAAEALRESAGVPLPPVHRADYERDVVLVRANIDEATFAAAWAAGRTLTLEQAVAEALHASPLGNEALL